MDERDGRRPPTRVDDGRSTDEQAEPASRPETPSPSLIQLGRAGRPPGILAAAFVLFIAVAILKPWPAAVRPPAPAEPRPVAGAEATPRPTADPLADLRSHCEQPLGWRVYSVERWADQTLRIWRSLQPGPVATDPSDPRIPAIPLGPAVELAGYCSPWDGPERPPAGSRLLAWSIQPGTGRASPIELEVVAPRPPSVLGALCGPPATPGTPSELPGAAAGSSPQPSARPGSEAAPSTQPATGIWPSGHFVFELSAAGWERWWAVDIPPPAVTRTG